MAALRPPAGFDIGAFGPFVYATMSWNSWVVRILDARTGEYLGLRRRRPPTLFGPAGEPVAAVSELLPIRWDA